jgi:hypothetical protein
MKSAVKYARYQRVPDASARPRFQYGGPINIGTSSKVRASARASGGVHAGSASSG